MLCNLIHGHMPCMKFLFVRPDVCRRLPSDSTSRWTPLPWAMRFPLLGLARDSHPLANTHAERTKKRPPFWGGLSYISVSYYSADSSSATTVKGILTETSLCNLTVAVYSPTTLAASAVIILRSISKPSLASSSAIWFAPTEP